MMPTFPSSPLKSRTAGFPQYGLKASLSDRTCLNDRSVKPAPSMPGQPRSLSPSFAHFLCRKVPGSVPRTTGSSMCRCSKGFRLSTPGVLGSGSSYVVSIRHGLIQPHAPVPQARCDFASRLYAAPSLCGSASATRGTFPTFAAVLSVHVADPTPAARRALPLYSHGDFRLPPTIKESPLAMPVSASNIRRGYSISGLHRSLYATTCTFALPSWLATTR